jgi:hypothetical protein
MFESREELEEALAKCNSSMEELLSKDDAMNKEDTEAAAEAGVKVPKKQRKDPRFGDSGSKEYS